MNEVVNIIHLSSDQVIPLGEKAIASEVLRRQSYLEEMATQRAKFQVWDGMIDKPAFRGISKIHKRIVRYAKNRNFHRCIIMEDDCKFSHPNSLKYFLSTVPQEYDLYFGCVYQGEVGENHRLLNGFSGVLTCYIVNSPFYDTFLKINSEAHLDNAIGEIAFSRKFYVSDPMICYQADGFSYNHSKQMHYGKYLDGRKLFTGL